MALLYPDIIRSGNPSAFGIVPQTEVTGSRSVATYAELATIPLAILSPSKEIQTKTIDEKEVSNWFDALGQDWYVTQENKTYRLTNITTDEDGNLVYQWTDTTVEVPEASTTTKGIVQLANSLDDITTNVVPTASQVKTAIGNAVSSFQNDRLVDGDHQIVFNAPIAGVSYLKSNQGQLIITSGTGEVSSASIDIQNTDTGRIDISASAGIVFNDSCVIFNKGFDVTGEAASFGTAPYLRSGASDDSQAVTLGQVKGLVAGGVHYKGGVAITAVGTDKVTLASTEGITSIAVGDMFTITNTESVIINGNTYNAGDSFIAAVASDTLTGVAISNFTWINSQDSDVVKFGTNNTFTGTNTFNNAVTFANAPTITVIGTDATSAATYGQITSAIDAVKQEIAGGSVTVATDRIGKSGAELVVGTDKSLTTSGMENITLAPGNSKTINIGQNNANTKILGVEVDIGTGNGSVSIHGTGEVTITASNAASGNQITFTAHNSDSATRTVTVSTGSDVETDAVTFGDIASSDKYGVVKVSDTLELGSGETGTIVPTVEAVVDAIGGISQDSITDGTSVIYVDTLPYPVVDDIVNENPSTLRAAALVSNSDAMIIAVGTGESTSPSISMYGHSQSSGIYNRILLSNREVNGNGATISIGGLGTSYSPPNEVGDISIIASDQVVITAGYNNDNVKEFGFGSGEPTEVVRRCDYASNINDGSEVIPGTVVTTSNYDVVVPTSVDAPVVPTLEALKSALASVNKVSADNSSLEEIVTLLNTIAGLFGAKDYVEPATAE